MIGSPALHCFYRLVGAFAAVNLLFLLLMVPFPVQLAGLDYSWQEASFTVFLQAVVSLALGFAAMEKLAGSEIGLRVFPAAVVSYLLWVCMLWRWIAVTSVAGGH